MIWAIDALAALVCIAMAALTAWTGYDELRREGSHTAIKKAQGAALVALLTGGALWAAWRLMRLAVAP